MQSIERADLHTHSKASDGTQSPGELVRAAHAAGVRAFALTDHDTIAGVAEAAAVAGELGMAFLRGIEVSCPHPRPGTLHLLGYGFDTEDRGLLDMVAELGAARAERARLIIERLARVEIALDLDEVRAEHGGHSRPHIAAALVSRGHALSSGDAFRRFLGGAGVAYVDNQPVETQRVIRTIREAGGLVSLAHPFQLRRESQAQLLAFVGELKEQGLEGIETHHGSHDTEMLHRLTRVADRLDLIPTGGSDYHGLAKPWMKLGEAGRRPIPVELYENVAGRLRRRNDETRMTNDESNPNDQCPIGASVIGA